MNEKSEINFFFFSRTQSDLVKIRVTVEGNAMILSEKMLVINETIKCHITYLMFVNWYDKHPTFRPSTLATPLSHCGCGCI